MYGGHNIKGLYAQTREGMKDDPEMIEFDRKASIFGISCAVITIGAFIAAYAIDTRRANLLTKELITLCDTNLDGRVSPEEWTLNYKRVEEKFAEKNETRRRMAEQNGAGKFELAKRLYREGKLTTTEK